MKAIEIIEGLTQEPEIGKVYTGKVRRVEAYGAFVEILPGQDGLVHISELAPYRVRQTTDVVKEGDEVTVKIIAVDPMGKIKLSRKQALTKEQLDAEMALAPVGAPGEDEGRDEFPRGGRRPGRAPRPLQPRPPRAEGTEARLSRRPEPWIRRARRKRRALSF